MHFSSPITVPLSGSAYEKSPNPEGSRLIRLIMVEAGRIELPSEKDSLEASTGLGQVLISPEIRPCPGLLSGYTVFSSRLPTNGSSENQSDKFYIRGTYRTSVPRMRLSYLGSQSVIVVVVGNYINAAFNEASGASACNSGFNIPVETFAPPCQRTRPRSRATTCI